MSNPQTSSLVFRPLQPALMDSMQTVLKGSWGSTCWCMHPRLTDAQQRALPGDGKLGPRRRAAMLALSKRELAPGLLAFDGDTPVGWIALGPRAEFNRVDRSRATPRVDDVDVWIVPCVTVRSTTRGQGIALGLIEAAADYARRHGAAALEAYPRAGSERTGDDNAYFGTEPLFKRAGFELIRGPLPGLPERWTPRVTMRKVLR